MRKDAPDILTPFHPVLCLAAMNLLLLIILFLVVCSNFAKPAGFEVRMPLLSQASGVLADQNIVITAENVLFLNDKVVTISELKKVLLKADPKKQNVLIRIDRRASMGRVIDVWDLCKALGSARVHMVASED